MVTVVVNRSAYSTYKGLCKLIRGPMIINLRGAEVFTQLEKSVEVGILIDFNGLFNILDHYVFSQ